LVRIAIAASALATFGLLGCGSSGSLKSSEERSLSVFAQRVQRQLDRATDPAAVKQNQVSTEELVHCVDELRRRKSSLHAKIEQSPDVATRERIELVRVERQLQMIDRLLIRYEQNAPALASGQ
jgi:hypothetical protein